MKPGTANEAGAIDEVLGTTEEELIDSESDELRDASFSLEYQLRDFFARNLNVYRAGESLP